VGVKTLGYKFPGNLGNFTTQTKLGIIPQGRKEPGLKG